MPKKHANSVGRQSPGKRRRVYECYWAHFAAETHLSEKSPFRTCGLDLVEFFSRTVWAFLRPSGRANAVAGCWPTCTKTYQY